MDQFLQITFILYLGSLLYSRTNYRKLKGGIYSTSISLFKVIIGCVLMAFAIINAYNHYNNNYSYNYYNHYNQYNNPYLGGIFLPIVIILQGLGTIKVGENGIHINGVTIYWNEIECYSWDIEKNNYLILNLKDRKPFLLWRKKVKYGVAQKDKFKLNGILKEHINRGV